MTYIWLGEITNIASDIGSSLGLSPGRRKAIVWTSAGIVLIGRLEKNFREILIQLQTFPLKKIRLKMSCAKSW